ncbi:MAG: cellulose synthase family protein [Candidatus Cyclobacteriaceae bacterium M2_1C_046]
MLELVIIIFYSLSLLLIFVFSLGQLHLAWHYLKAKKEKEIVSENHEELPSVTIQLPVYNEKYVIERLLRSISSLDYPTSKLEIQVLDDSNDDTNAIIAAEVARYQKQGIDIKQICRPDRNGFKAGALAYGTEIAKGDFIAIFDADFMPNKDFLLKTVSYFTDPNIGVVQTRWGHLNRDYSLLTKLQAFGLDAHFSIEQTGRSHADSFINFNGTGGVWRKTCIADAGGWSADTLTEDLDLSYRAQLKGWKFKFVEDYDAPAELPVIMPAIKSQQYRWNKGAAETARKNIGKIFSSKKSIINKIHATLHLLNSSVFVCLLFAAVFSIPILYIKADNPQFNPIFLLGSVFLIGFFSIALFYWIAAKTTYRNGAGNYYFKTFPVFLTVSMGLSLHNGMAVLEGLFGFKSDFIRTPKFNVINSKDPWKGNSYVKPKLNILTVLEGIFCLYFIFGIVSGIRLNDWSLMIFHFMLALGFALVFLYSLKAIKNV